MEDLKKYFKDHILTEILNTEKTKIFEFRNKDGKNYYYQRWIIDIGTLIVTGDNYSSIYKWNDSNITLKFLATCNLGYFNSKCLADKDGSNQTVYDSDYASEYLKDIASDRIYYENQDEIDITEEKWKLMDSKQKFDVISFIILQELNLEESDLESLFYHENVYEAAEMLHDTKNEFMFGIDGWEYVRNLECLTMTPKMHLTALMVANELFPNAF